MIMNTDRSRKKGTHWWSLLEIHSKQEMFLFESYGFIGLKKFIIDNDRKLIDRFLFGFTKMDKKDNKINLTYLEFAPLAHGKVDQSQLTTTSQDLIHTMYEFSKVHKPKSVKFYMVDDCLQDLESDTCEIFQLYFYTNLFLPNYKNKILNHKALDMRTITALLNEIFSLEIPENERRVENFAQYMNIKRE